MNLFQWLTISILAILLLWEVTARRRRMPSTGIWLLRCTIWIGAALAIAFPGMTQGLASGIGIGRGADVVMYSFVLAFLFTSFYFYARMVNLQRQVTQLVRHLAIQEAQRGSDAGNLG
jgi:hypothetical protein